MGCSKTIGEIVTAFSVRWPDREGQKKQGGKTVKFIPWYEVVSIANHITEGHWDYKIIQKGHDNNGKFLMTVGVTIYAKDGTFYREGTGTEDSTTDSWGDYQSNAESMALRRAFAKFQLAIYLYRK